MKQGFLNIIENDGLQDVFFADIVYRCPIKPLLKNSLVSILVYLVASRFEFKKRKSDMI